MPVPGGSRTGALGLWAGQAPVVVTATCSKALGGQGGLALFGGPDGMSVIVPIIALAARLLRPGGKLGIEHDDTTADQVVAALERDGTFGDITARRDLTGRPRFVTATRR